MGTRIQSNSHTKRDFHGPARWIRHWRARTVLCVLAAGLALPAPVRAQISLVQVTSCPLGPYPATTCTIPATGSGNLIVVAWASASSLDNISTLSVTDSAGNTYARAGNALAINVAASQIVDFWYAKNSVAGATGVTITPNLPGSSGTPIVWEFSGADRASPFDAAAVLNSQPVTRIPNAAAVSTTAPGVVISIANPEVQINGLQTGSTFTNDSARAGIGAAHLITSAAGTYTTQWISWPGSYASSTVAFRAAVITDPINACDLAPPYGTVDTNDVLAAINMALGLTPCTATIAGANVCNVVVVQRVVNASQTGACLSTPGVHSVGLTWTASASPGVTAYRIFRSTTQGDGYELLVSLGIATSYMDSTVESGKTYYYVVTAVDGNSTSSDKSNEVQAVIPVP